jgi:hypothetical protein
MHCGEQGSCLIMEAGIMISPKRKYSLFPSATRKSGKVRCVPRECYPGRTVGRDTTRKSGRVRCVPRECYPGRTVGRDRFLQSTLLIKDEGSVQSHDVGDGLRTSFQEAPSTELAISLGVFDHLVPSCLEFPIGRSSPAKRTCFRPGKGWWLGGEMRGAGAAGK